MELIQKPEAGMVMQQGVQQLHDGRNFQVGIRSDGSQAMVEYIEELREPDPMLEKVLVESQGRPGETYESIAFFQTRRSI